MRAEHVLAVLAERLPADAVLVEETPSSRPDLHRLIPIRSPLGFLSAAMGGLGFALPAALGVKLGRPDRPVVAVVGDGSALFQVQALWSAAHYGIGVLVVVLANGRYAIMDRLAERRATKPPWPAFEQVSLAVLAKGFGCPARRIDRYEDMVAAFDELMASLAGRTEPLLLELVVPPEATFQP
jgi:benzoylformate decarboxylase